MGAVFLETTEVPDTRTVAEIQELLARKGALSVMVEYGPGGIVNSLSFQLKIDEQRVPFRLPCRWESVEKILRNCGRKIKKRDTYPEWARRVAWRQILRWVQAQLAMIETGMVKSEEVFLPFALVRVGDADKTMYQVIADRKFLALPPPSQQDAPPG